MSKVQINLKLNRLNSIYYGGEVLSGILSISSPNTLSADLTTIRLFFTGQAKNNWVNKNSDKIYDSSDEVFSRTIEMSLANPTTTNMVTGSNNYSFEVCLPDNLPSTYEAVFGQISYSIRVELIGEDEKPKFSFERPFNIISKVDLSKQATINQPVEAVDTTEFTCCNCLPCGTVRTVLSVPKSGFCVNEAIPTTVIMYNGSRRRIDNIRLSVVQHCTFTAKSRYESAEDTKHTYHTVTDKSKGSLMPHRFLKAKNEMLAMPTVVPSFDSKYITVEYLLMLNAVPEIEIEIPITIGSIITEEIDV